MGQNSIYRTLPIFVTNNGLASINMDVNIGKYFNFSAVRISKAYFYCFLADDSQIGGGDMPYQAVPGQMWVTDLGMMKAPSISTGGSGTVVTTQDFSILLRENHQLLIDGDCVLLSPEFTIDVLAYPVPGQIYPTDYRVFFYITLEFEFNVANLSESEVKSFLEKTFSPEITVR